MIKLTANNFLIEIFKKLFYESVQSLELNSIASFEQIKTTNG